MEKNRILYIVLACIIVVAAIIIAVKGLNFGLGYGAGKQVQVYIGKEFNNADILAIAKEVVGNKEVAVQKVELYEEIALITVKDISDEQIEELNNKINEKYELENTVNEDIEVDEIPKLRGRSIVYPYISATLISLVIVLIYGIIYSYINNKMMHKNIQIHEILIKLLGFNIFAQVIYLCILAITRLPVNTLTMPAVLTIYVATTLLIFNSFDKKEEA